MTSQKSNDPALVSDSSIALNDRLIDIETKLAYQEDLLQSLNDTVTKQSAQVDVLELKLKKLRDQLSNDSESSQPSQDASDELPPHY